MVSFKRKYTNLHQFIKLTKKFIFPVYLTQHSEIKSYRNKLGENLEVFEK